MKAIFLANNKGNIDYVYPKETQERIKRLIDIDLDKVYCQEDLEANPNGFGDVEYIFSTWSMPGGSEDKDDFARFFPNAKALFYAAGSVKYFAQHYFDKNIRIFSAFAANAVPVAEFSVAQILLANKGYYQSLRAFKNGDSYKNAGDISRAHAGNYNTNVGIVGAGMIGKRVIELLKPYKLNIKIYDVFVDAQRAKELGGEKVDTLKELFETCDVVSNHLANVPATVGIFKGELFENMKPNGTFINTGRGAQVDEEGMLSALKKRGDVSAILDVTIEEPPTNKDFYELENIFLTPHIAGSQANEVARMSEMVVDQFENLLNGKPTQYEITEKMLATMA
ncbi:MAG: hydroxyacid dehydrogenase [Ruminococcaceae bacterium]|nr:hydroxyacid dehydrogenase [Oscillospiraceae bacterium]